MKKRETCHMIPVGEKRCVWMTTGLITYKLCVRNYDCETCIFDQVMRDEMGVQSSRLAPEAALASEPHKQETAPRAKAALFYHQNHCWVNVENPDMARIGMDTILTKLVSRIKTVALPQEGATVTQGQCFAHVIQETHILQLIAPLSGTVLTANPRLKKDPQLLLNAPWDEGWLVTIQPENLEHDLKSLLFGRKAQAWLQDKEQVVAKAGASMLNQTSGLLGPTLQDGGEQIVGFVDFLSSEQFEQLIDLASRNEAP